MPTVFFVLFAILGSSGVLMAVSRLAFNKLPNAQKLHDKEKRPPMHGLSPTKSAVINSVVSTGLLFGFVFLMGNALISTAPVPAWQIAIEAAGTLLVYDLLYYFLHRHLFHGWKPLIKVHSVHHTVKYPTARDSLYIHPVETFLGVLVLLGCLYAMGPMSVWSFGIVLFFYTHLNITVHWGLRFRAFPLNLVSYMSNKHDLHHKSMRAGNFASITPLPDLIFNTAEGAPKKTLAPEQNAS